MIEPDYVSFETALLLKQKGFDIPTVCFWPDISWSHKQLFNVLHTGEGDTTKDIDRESWGDIIPAPEHWQVIKWLRLVHGIDITVMIRGAASYEAYIHKDRDIIYANTLFPSTPMPDAVDPYPITIEKAIQYTLTHLLPSGEQGGKSE